MSAQRVIAQVAFGLLLFGATFEVAARVAFRTPAFVQRVEGATAAGRRAVWSTHASSQQSKAFFRYPFVAHDPTLGWTTRTPTDQDVPHTTILPDSSRDVGPPSAPAPRIAFIGDSFTFGLDVADDETWVSDIQRRVLADVQNYGVPGYGLEMAALRYTRDVAPTQPDIVVLGLNGLMMWRMARHWDAWAKPWITVDDGRLTVHGQPVPSPQEVGHRRWRPRLLDVVAIWWEMAGGNAVSGGPSSDIWTMTAAQLDALQADVTDAGATFVVVNLAVSLDPSRPPPPHDPKLIGLLDDLCARPATHCTDAAPAFADVRPEDWAPLRREAHWSPAGHTRVADVVIADWVTTGLVQAR